MKDIADIIYNLIVSIGIIVGGLWTYLIFVKQRVSACKVVLDLVINERDLKNDLKLVHITLKISNIGNAILKSDYAEIRLRQVFPVPKELENTFQPEKDPVPEGKTQIDWPLLAGREWNWKKGDFEIEPGEKDEIHADFVIDSFVETIELYCYIRNSKKEGLGWPLTEIYELKQETCKMSNGNTDDSRQKSDGQQKQTEQQNQKQQRQQQQQQQQQDRKKD
ncbi:MAG TPA: hypothetical protein PKN04_16000 [bacterium]|nr:hypothetical protein [bacterium]HPG47240.1 hypothetical protein [bacterium]